jgi:hypothetical protein
MVTHQPHLYRWALLAGLVILVWGVAALATQLAGLA